MPVKPKELNEKTTRDEQEIKRIIAQIDKELKSFGKQTRPKKTFTIQLETSYGEPSYFAKEELRRIYLEAGWEDVEFRTREIESDLCNYIYEVTLTRKVEGYEEEDLSSPLSKRGKQHDFLRTEEWLGKGEIEKLIQEELQGAAESWIEKEIRGNNVSPLIVIKRLELYCQKISNGESKEEKVSNEDIIGLEKIIPIIGLLDVEILRYVMKPYPLVNFLIEGAGGRRWVTFYNKNDHRAGLH